MTREEEIKQARASTAWFDQTAKPATGASKLNMQIPVFGNDRLDILEKKVLERQ